METKNQKKINWKVRFKNKLWLGSFLSLIIGFVFQMFRLFDIYPEFSESQVTMTINNLLTFLGLFGVLIDPTTEGLYDSERALGYDKPWSDEAVEEETEESEPEEEEPEPETEEPADNEETPDPNGQAESESE